jgi:hypothetical protein
VEKNLLSALSSADRAKFVRMLATVVADAEASEAEGNLSGRKSRRSR